MLKFSLAIHYSFIYSIKWGLNSHILASQTLGIGFKMITKKSLNPADSSFKRTVKYGAFFAVIMVNLRLGF